MTKKDVNLLEEAYQKVLIKENAEDVESVLAVKNAGLNFSCDSLKGEEEAAMAKSNLYSMCKNAKAILDSLEHGIRLEPWQLEKVAVAADNIGDVAQVIEYEHQTTIEASGIKENIDAVQMQDDTYDPLTRADDIYRLETEKMMTQALSILKDIKERAPASYKRLVGMLQDDVPSQNEL